MSLETVLIEHAFCWKCSVCNVMNFLPAIKVDVDGLSEEDEEEARELLDLDVYEELPQNSLLAFPHEVQCSQCGTEFITPDSAE